MSDYNAEEKAIKLINNNFRNNGEETKLLKRARTMGGKIKRTYLTRKGHWLVEIEGSNGETYETWFYNSGKVHCNCAFSEGMESSDRQYYGCKHILTGALYMLCEIEAPQLEKKVMG